MYVFLISAPTRTLKLDFYDSAVVVAKSYTDASTILPNGSDEKCSEKEDLTHGSWCRRSQVKVKLIGEAAARMKRGVVCASFNAA